LSRTLKLTFPELEWKGRRLNVIFVGCNSLTHLIVTKKRDFWKDPKNCRDFFDDYAKEHGFDPNISGSWYAADLTAIPKTAVCFFGLRYYNPPSPSDILIGEPTLSIHSNSFP